MSLSFTHNLLITYWHVPLTQDKAPSGVNLKSVASGASNKAENAVDAIKVGYPCAVTWDTAASGNWGGLTRKL